MPSISARAFTRLSAACALSFITSPSWPVRIRPPLPGTRAHSMNRISPPLGVQARPVATPGTDVRMATSFSNLRAPRMSWRPLASMRMVVFVLGNAHGHVMADGADLALEIAHAGLARVAVDDGADRLLGDVALLGAQPVS